MSFMWHLIHEWSVPGMNLALPDIIIIYVGRLRLYLYGARLVDGVWKYSRSEMPASDYEGFTQDATTQEGYTLRGKHEPRFEGQQLATPVILYRGDLDQALTASKILHDAILKDITPDAAE